MSIATAERKRTPSEKKLWQQAVPKKRKPLARQAVKKKVRVKRHLDYPALFKTAADAFARGVLILVFCYGAFHAYLFFTSSSQFAITEVGVTGLGRLEQSRLLEAMPPVREKNLFLLNLKQLTASLTHHPWIKTATVQRKWPNAITIQITERVPYARIDLDQVYLIDNFGFLVSADLPEYSHLPLITGMTVDSPQLGQRIGFSHIREGLRVMHYLNRHPFFENDPVFAVKVSGTSLLTFSTRKKGLKIRMATHNIQEGFQNFKIILNALQPKGTGIEMIDLSFRNKVVIRPKPGSQGFGKVHKA